MASNHSYYKQRGSILIVAISSLLAVSAVAAGLNVLLRQQAQTSTYALEGMQNIAFTDSVFLFVEDKLEASSVPPDSAGPPDSDDSEQTKLNDGGLLLNGSRIENPTRAQLGEALSDGEKQEIRTAFEKAYEDTFSEERIKGLLDRELPD